MICNIYAIAIFTLNFVLRQLEIVDLAYVKSNTHDYAISEALLKTPRVPQKQRQV